MTIEKMIAHRAWWHILSASGLYAAYGLIFHFQILVQYEQADFIQTAFFWAGYFQLVWGLKQLMASRRRPRWWGLLGLLGPVGLLLVVVPSGQEEKKYA